MFSTLILALLAGITPTEAVPSATQGSRAEAEPRRFQEINLDLRAAIRREATAADAAQRAAGVRALAAVYREIVEDNRLHDSPTLKELRAKAYSRLVRIKTELEKELARQQRHADPVGRDELESRRRAELAVISLSAQMGAVSYTMGGPIAIFTEAGEGLGGGMGPGDHGELLVELIEKTISPESWDVNGGPGTIMYYAPLKVLVISATGEVHGNVGGVLDGLRRAGN